MNRALQVDVPRWEPYDLAFASDTEHENPFTVRLVARANGPNGETLNVPGFYDGDDTWKVRFAPLSLGPWELKTESDNPKLDGKSATVECVANANESVHGGLLVDPDSPHHFVWEDGARYLLLAYECDWLWALDMDDPELPTLEPFLDKLAEHGFNHILLNAYAHDCGWRKGKTGPDDYGPPPMYAWLGSNEEPDHRQFNLEYWQHYDRMMRALYERGIVAHIMIKVYNKMVNWPRVAGAEDDLYFRWVIARYAAYPNVVWSFSKESHNERDVDYKLGRVRLIRETDPYRRLITTHDDDAAYRSGYYDNFLDFRTDQQHGNWREVILAQRQRREWPVFNSEYGYEHGPGGIEDKTYGVVQPPEEVIRRAWVVQMAGGYGAYYYTYTAWDVLRPEDTPPGYAYCKHLADFFEGTGYWAVEPTEDLVSDGYCLARPGEEYVVYLDEAKPFTLQVEAAQPLQAEWFQPLTGARQVADPMAAGTASLAPPADWGDGPVALHVGEPPPARSIERSTLMRPAPSMVETHRQPARPAVPVQQSGAGTGLTGHYFTDAGLTQEKVNRLDPVIDFHWDGKSPAQGVSGERFSARWRGRIEAPADGEYTFIATANDGVRVWIDGKLLCLDWSQHRAREARGTIALKGGMLYDIVVEYFQEGVSSELTLFWEPPG
ncbi:MAG: PA14 domain-containing protein, partial [Armatimonadota bacterium]